MSSSSTSASDLSRNSSRGEPHLQSDKHSGVPFLPYAVHIDSTNSSPYLDAPPPYTEHAETPVVKRKPTWKSFFSSSGVPFQHKSATSSHAQSPVFMPDTPAGIALHSDRKSKATRPKPLFTRDFSTDHYNPDAVLAMDMIRGTTILLHQKRG